MNPKLQIASLIIGVAFFFYIFYVIRKKTLSPTYSILWIMLALFFISVPVFESFYVFLSRSIFGFYAENMIYIAVIGFLLIYVLFLTLKVVKLNDQVKELISFTAILESKIKDKID